MKRITVILILLFIVEFAAGQIVGWQMNSPNTTGNEATLDARIVDPNLNMSTLLRGAGVNASNLARAFSSTGYQVGATQVDAIANDQYLEFEVSAAVGFNVSLATLDANFRRSKTAPTMFLWRYSLDGATFFDIGIPINYNAVGGGGQVQAQIDLSGITDLQNVASGTSVTFRLYGWGATDVRGTFAIGRRDDVELAIGGLVEVDLCSGSTVTWNGTAWYPAAPTINNAVVIDGDYTVNSINSFSACSLFINQLSTSTSNSITVIVDNGGFIEVENDATVAGTLIVETQGSFVQRADSGKFTVNATGVARVNKITPVKTKWFFYTYWSSPVVNETIENVFPGVNPDRRFFFEAENFIDEHTQGTTNSIPDDIDDNGDDWNIATGTMQPGVGYASVEAKPFTPGAGQASFEGAFNTSDVTVPVFENAANVAAGSTTWSLIGNPYPSAIDFNDFYAANSAVIDGAAYFWSQVSPPDAENPGNQQSNFNNNDYAIYTVGSGGIVAGASSKMPNQFIPSGQGFFIAGLDNSTVTFTNAMRTANSTSNMNFYKSTAGKKQSTEDEQVNKFWVNLTASGGVFNQILVAYVPRATKDNDGLSYDAPRKSNRNNTAILYSLMDFNQEKYAIQGRGVTDLNTSEVVKLGFATGVQKNTIYKFSLAQFEGEFLASHAIYIKDDLLGLVHNLSNSDYTFTSNIGTFNDRFQIVYNTNVLSIAQINTETNFLKIVALSNNRVRFTAASSIASIVIFDLLGKPIHQFKGANKSETFKVPGISGAIYIAKVTLTNGITLTKKVLLK